MENLSIMNDTEKKQIIDENIKIIKNIQHLCEIKPVKIYYNKNFKFKETNQFCDVEILPINSITLCKQYEQYRPVILNTIDHKFNGLEIDNYKNCTNEMIYLRTSFSYQCLRKDMYPLKLSEVVYSSKVIVMRDENLELTSDVIEISIITANPIQNLIMKKNIMNLGDYFLTKDTIENIFHTAYLNGHQVLILNDFGCKKFNIPVQDLIDIYNMVVLTYGSLFKLIIFSIEIMNQEERKYYNMFENGIIKPQNLVLNNKFKF